jgi:hypothetical protein
MEYILKLIVNKALIIYKHQKMELLIGGGGGLLGHLGSSHNLDGRSTHHSRASTPTMKVRTQIVSKAPLPPSHYHIGSFRNSVAGGGRDEPKNNVRGMSSSVVVVDQQLQRSNQTPMNRYAMVAKENYPMIT